MRPHEAELWQQLSAGLENCHRDAFPLPGVQSVIQRDVFLRQLVDSIRRVQFVRVIADRPIDPRRADGLSPMFDPIRAAVLNKQRGHLDEACWLAFLFVHFGRHPISKYRYVREFYSALGQRPAWSFAAVSNDIAGMRAWLDANEDYLRRGSNRGFGNHRKYLSLSGSKNNATGHAFDTYVHWVRAYGDHEGLFAIAAHHAEGSPEKAFEWLYQSMRSVASYGRIGRFDYLTMLQKLRLADIHPGRAYLDASTRGPNKGARQLLEGAEPLTISELERRVRIVGDFLGVGMQEMEDSLCNWGKNPGAYKYFRG